MTYSFFVELVCKQYSNCLMEMLYYANEINNRYLKNIYTYYSITFAYVIMQQEFCISET